MESEHIEKLFLEGSPPASVSRDDVRHWVIGEQRRGSRRRRLVFSAALIGFVVALGGLLVMMDAQMDQIRQTVDRQPLSTMKKLDEVTLELCNELPAEYFVQQLTLRRAPGGVSSLKGF